MAYVRTVRTASGATAVQIVYSMRRGSRRIEHLGSGHDEAEVEALKAAARQRLVQGQAVLDLDLDVDAGAAGPARIVSSQAGHLWDALQRTRGAPGARLQDDQTAVPGSPTTDRRPGPGLQRQIEEDTYCIDVLQQIAAVNGALQNVAIGLLDEHVGHCVANAAAAGDQNKARDMVTEATQAIARIIQA